MRISGPSNPTAMNASAGVTKIQDAGALIDAPSLPGVGLGGEPEADAEDRRRHDGGDDDLTEVAGADVGAAPRADEPADGDAR